MKLYSDYINEHMFSGKKVTLSSQQINFVDLDLPSGLKWATCNVGATKPEDPGLLFQIGTLKGYRYDDVNHGFLNEDEFVDKIFPLLDKNNGKLPEKLDIAKHYLKDNWRTPTIEELRELKEHTTQEFCTINGTEGIKLISKTNNTNYIFIPLCGVFVASSKSNGFSFKEMGTFLMSSTLNNNLKECLHWLCLTKAASTTSSSYPYNAISVRGVKK